MLRNTFPILYRHRGKYTYFPVDKCELRRAQTTAVRGALVAESHSEEC